MKVLHLAEKKATDYILTSRTVEPTAQARGLPPNVLK